MTKNEVIERLKFMKAMTAYVDVYTDEEGNDIPYNLTLNQKDDIQAITEAIKCVEMQIPKYPTVEEFSDEDGYEHIHLICECRNVVGWGEYEDVGITYSTDKYCSQCGQSIKAKGEE